MTERHRKTKKHKGEKKNANHHKFKLRKGLRSPQHVVLHQLAFPDSVSAPFKYFDTAHGSLNNAGVKFANIRHRPTSFYDLDPSVGGTTVVGYTNWSTVYQYYRVTSFSHRVSTTNADAFGYIVQTIPLQLDPGVNNSTAYSTWGMNEYAKMRQISDKGGSPDTITINNRVNCKKFVGDKTQAYDDNYASAFGTSPANNIYVPVSIYSIANNFVNGCQLELTILIRVRMWERTDLLDDPLLLQKVESGQFVPTNNYSKYICVNCGTSDKARIIIPELGSKRDFTLVCVKCYELHATRIIDKYSKRLAEVSLLSTDSYASSLRDHFRQKLHCAISNFKLGRSVVQYEDSDESSCSDSI